MIKDVIIIDNSAASYLFQTTNAILVSSWFDDMNDTSLLDICPVLETTLYNIADVRWILDANNRSQHCLGDQANQALSEYGPKEDQDQMSILM